LLEREDSHADGAERVPCLVCAGLLGLVAGDCDRDAVLLFSAAFTFQVMRATLRAALVIGALLVARYVMGMRELFKRATYRFS
jgi:hypothetical protein